MASNILTAKVAQVPFGLIKIEGLMFEDGSFGIALIQINQLISFSASNNVISRDLKRFLGKDFSPSKVKVEGLKQLINCLTLPNFEVLLAKTDRAGNLKAQELRDSLIGLSLHQLFSDAFGIEFEKEERQKYLINRQRGKVVRRKMTDAIKSWCESNNQQEKISIYCIRCSDTLNLGLFGKTAKELRTDYDVKNNALLRDCFTSDQLHQIELIEAKVVILIDALNIKPTEAISRVISFE